MCIGYIKYYAFLYKELEHPQILISKGILDPIPSDSEGQPYIKYRTNYT